MQNNKDKETRATKTEYNETQRETRKIETKTHEYLRLTNKINYDKTRKVKIRQGRSTNITKANEESRQGKKIRKRLSKHRKQQQ